MKLNKLLKDFFESEKSTGIILVFVTAVSLFFANSFWQSEYLEFWNYPIGSHSIVGWINDGLMTIFFLLIGLELEREIYDGELSNPKNAALPIFGAIGGMIIPAAIFLMFNFGTDTRSGAGIPMATDIAFAVGILSLIGKRVPAALKVFLLALAIIDDLGAIIVIAVFYTKTVLITNLFIALGIWLLLFILNRLKVLNLIPYLIGGGFMWYFMLHSGIHSTITGIILAFVIPFGDGSEKTSSYVLQRSLHYPVALVILPLFAAANTCIPLAANWQHSLSSQSSIGIIAGLVIGKPLGIWSFAVIASLMGLCALPNAIRWRHIIGVGFLGGIGFTMSIFITLLAFEDRELIDNAKISILLASIIASIVGFCILTMSFRAKKSS